jgi:hypothetical protein
VHAPASFWSTGFTDKPAAFCRGGTFLYMICLRLPDFPYIVVTQHFFHSFEGPSGISDDLGEGDNADYEEFEELLS